jgi:hypothetical protein
VKLQKSTQVIVERFRKLWTVEKKSTQAIVERFKNGL